MEHLTSNFINGSYYYLLIITAIISIFAQIKVQSTFSKYSKIANRRGLSGAQVANEILTSQSIGDVAVGQVAGNLTDHYNPASKQLNLSETVYSRTSISAAAVAAHECGHACQHAFGYFPIKIRTALVPIVNFSSKFSWILIIIGLFYNSSSGTLMLKIGIILFSAVVIFQLVTLPVEFNASERALKILREDNMLDGDEIKEAKKVLSAAALTYVAGAATAVLQLLRLILIARDRD